MEFQSISSSGGSSEAQSERNAISEIGQRKYRNGCKSNFFLRIFVNIKTLNSEIFVISCSDKLILFGMDWIVIVNGLCLGGKTSIFQFSSNLNLKFFQRLRIFSKFMKFLGMFNIFEFQG